MMDASTNTTDANGPDRSGRKERGGRSTALLLAKEDWIQLYTSRILKAWFHQDAPLGLAWAYANWIHKDLSECYRKPLMRAFIEETYRVTANRNMRADSQ